MGYIHTVQIDQSNPYLIEPKLYATAGGTSTALTAGINNFELFAGAYVNIKVGEVGANATLNVNNTGDIDIYYNSAQINANTMTSGNIYTFIYDGSHWVLVGDITAKNIMIGTTQDWWNHSSYVAPAGTIIIYTDHGSYIDNNNRIVVPGIKISNGTIRVVDTPYVGSDVEYAIRTDLNAHINNTDVHVTPELKTFWSNKLNYNTTIIDETLEFNQQ